jgi:hypothetical protein
MIQANELKVNNRFIREIHNQRGLEYDHDFILTEEWMGKLFSNDSLFGLQDLSPIPLTPKILENCGFNKDNYGIFCFVKDGGKYISGCEILLWVKFNGATLQVCTGDELDNLFELCHILYLHELQNLYFALTSKELNVQP